MCVCGVVGRGREGEGGCNCEKLKVGGQLVTTHIWGPAMALPQHNNYYPKPEILNIIEYNDNPI